MVTLTVIFWCLRNSLISLYNAMIRQQVLPSKVAIGSRVFEIPLELVPSTLLNTSYVTVDMVNKVVELIVQNPKAVLRHQHSSVCHFHCL